jgi:NAD(P)-dependent dehydrogenase (short-subunit alcohol dehydrogenase family)
MEGLAGKVAIVTGAADGLGRATSRAMAAKGMRVLLVDIDGQRLAETEALIRDTGGEAAAFRADVSDAAQVRGYVAKAISRFGRIAMRSSTMRASSAPSRRSSITRSTRSTRSSQSICAACSWACASCCRS